MTVTNTSIPTISGVARQGQVLTTSNGSWTFDEDYLTYTYRWLRCDAAGDNPVAISGATSTQYTLQAADVGKRIRSEVTATEHSYPNPPPVGLRAALGSTGDATVSAVTGAALGFKIMRTPDWSPGTGVSQFVNDLAIYNSRDIEPLVLINTEQMNSNMNEMPGNLQAIAAAVGPGGSQAHPTRPARWWEIGNEQFYKYSPKPGPEYGDEYAAGWIVARNAIKAGNANCLVGFTLDTDGGGQPQYDRIVQLIYSVDPDIHDLVDAWIFHHYGPVSSSSHTSKMTGMLSAVEARGAPTNIPVIVTEDGISSDNGRTLDSNWGWATNLTYTQAGALHRQKFIDMQTHPTFGSRLSIWTQYQARDISASGASNSVHSYEGATKIDGSSKGDMTQAARDNAAAHP